MRRFLGAMAVLAMLNIFFVLWARAGEDGKVVLETPGQIEHFMQLDVPAAFSHDAMFLAAEKGVRGILDLRLKDALDLGIKNNLTSRLAGEKVEEALVRKWQAMSGLLPYIEGSVMERRTFKENLEAQGTLWFYSSVVRSI